MCRISFSIKGIGSKEGASVNICEELIDSTPEDKIHLTSYLPDVINCVIIVSYGLGEFSGRYQKWAEKFTEIQCAVLVYDQRGHGKTPGKKGIVSSYDLFFRDIDCVRKKAADLYSGVPVILYGHSMGGNISLNYILKGFAGNTGSDGSKHIPITCAVVSSPWLRVPRQPPRVLVKVLGRVGKIFPHLMYRPRISLQDLSRDQQHLTETDPESLLKQQLGFSILCQIIQAGEYALAHADNVNIPLLLMCAEKDLVVSPAAIEQFAKSAGDRIEYKSWDMYHELHNDIGRDQVFDCVARFITDHLPD